MAKVRDWRVAESLDKLKEQLDKAYPKRSKVSDGGIGDPRHQSKNSDHNPWVDCWRSDLGVVTARDFTHDPKGGLNCHDLAQALVDSQDSRIKYIIWYGKIISANRRTWKWRKFRGKNKHVKHLHLSVKPQPTLYDSTLDWQIMSRFKIGSRGDRVKAIQKVLHGLDLVNDIDGIFGKKTEAGVKAYQAINGLEVDGIVGKKTLSAMNLRKNGNSDFS